jgi:hypothetical protein
MISGVSAPPPDVRKVYDFPVAVVLTWGYAPKLGRSPEKICLGLAGEAEPHRTSGGRAESEMT